MTRLALAGIILLALAARLVAAIVIPDQTATLPDAIVYRELGRDFWSTFQISRPYYMPLYPMLVGLTGPGWGELALNIGLSTATVWLVFELALQIFKDDLTAFMAAAGAALYPYFIFFSIVGLTEPLFIALVVAAFLLWYRGTFAAAAVAATLAILTRPVFDLIAPLLVLWFALVVHRMPAQAALRKLLTYAAIYCVLMAPWWLHNYHAYGGFVRLNLGGGLALYSGNNSGNPGGGIDTGLVEHTAPLMKIGDPIARDRALGAAAIGYIEEHPRQFLAQSVEKFERFWRLWPATENYGGRLYLIASLLSFVPALLLTLLYLISPRHWRRISPMLLFGGYLTAIHMVFPGSIRYRLPLEPFLIVIAAAALTKPARRIFLNGRTVGGAGRGE